MLPHWDENKIGLNGLRYGLLLAAYRHFISHD